MLSTLRIWKWTAMVDNDYHPGLFRQLLKNWPWRTPWRTVESWKYTYKWYGGREFLKRRIEKLLSSAHFWLFTKYSKEFRRQLRVTYLESAIWSKECLIRHYEEMAEEQEKC
jgi:hypothetical protein